MAPLRTPVRMDAASALPIATVDAGMGIDKLRECADEKVVQWALLRWEIGGGDFNRIKLVALVFNSDEIPAVSRSRQNLRTPKVLQRFGDVHATVELHRKADITTECIEERVKRVFSGDHLNVDLPRLMSREDITLMKSVSIDSYKGKPRIRLDSSTSITEEPPVEACDTDDSSAGIPAKTMTTRKVTTSWSAADALSMVAGNDERCNWVLLDPEKMDLHAHGSEGMDEMKSHFADDKVQYGLLRLAFAPPEGDSRRLSEGTGGKARRLTKHVFVQWVGPNVGTVKRGRHIAKRSDAEILIRKYCAYALAVTADRPQDITLEGCISELRRLTVTEVGTGSVRSAAPSPQESLNGSFQRTPPTSPKGSSDTPSPLSDHSMSGDSSFDIEGQPGMKNKETAEAEMLPDPDTAVALLRDGNGAWEWVLLGPMQPKAEVDVVNVTH